MSGNDAVALAAYSGVCVITGYPARRRAGVGNLWHRKSDYPDIEIQWSTNEKVALEIAPRQRGQTRRRFALKMSGLNVAYTLNKLCVFRPRSAMVLYVCTTPEFPQECPSRTLEASRRCPICPFRACNRSGII